MGSGPWCTGLHDTTAQRHFGLSRNSITTESVDVRGTHPKSGCQHAGETANITIGWRRISGHCGNSPHSHPLPPIWVPPPCHWVHLHHWSLGPLDFPQMTPWGCSLSSLVHFGLEGLQCLTQLFPHLGPKHLWSVLSWMWTMGPLISPCLGWAYERPHNSHPTQGMCLGTRWVTTPHGNIFFFLPVLQWSRLWGMIGLPNQTVVALKLCIMAITLDAHLKPTSSSVSDSLSTPLHAPYPSLWITQPHPSSKGS